MEFNNVEELRNFIPTEKEHQMFEEVSCIKTLHHFKPRDIYPEMLGKVCYVTKKKLTIETRTEESKPDEKTWGATPWSDKTGLAVATTLRMKMMLGHQGFLITEQEKTGTGMMRFTAERMPEVDWDEITPLWDYPENVVVNTPLYYPQFVFLFKRIDSIGIGWGKWYKIDWLIKNYKAWLFAPTYFCIMCGKHHQGTHRLSVARELKMPTIKVRIIRHWWVRDTTIPKRLEYYLYGPNDAATSASLKPYKKHDERLMTQKHHIKPSKVYQEYLRLPKSERGYRRHTVPMIRSIGSKKK